MPALVSAASSRPRSIYTLVLDSRDGLSVRDRYLVIAAVLGAHAIGFWALMQVDSVRDAVREVAPMMVDLVVPDAPRTTAPAPPLPPLPPPLLPKPLRTQAVTPSPVLAAPAPEPVAAQAFTAPEPAPTKEAVAATAAQPTPSAPAPAYQPPAPPPRKVIPATAVRYLIEPPFELPRASRRAGEHGLVTLRVVVSAQGEPLQVRLLRTSGYPRLDEQALWAMRQARFQPYTENGLPVEIEATATADYPQE